MNRSLKLSMLMALALGSTQVAALDLGQIQVKSALGQPLLAEIPLHPATAAELQNLTVQLASSEEFARAGIVGGRPAVPLHFSVAKSASGQQIIRITSSVAVDDPYLDLLLEINGKAGKSVREFAILLDPPGMSSAPPAAPTPAPAVAATNRSAPAPTAAEPRARRSTPAAAPAPRTTAATASGKYGPVQPGQTLSSIARDNAASGVDVSQMLLALKQANPDAFYRDNINALKSGVVLRVPAPSEAQSMAVAAAIAEVRRENSDWRNGNVSKPGTLADAATHTSASTSADHTDVPAGDRLALVPPKQGGSVASGGGGSADKGGKASAAAQQELLRTKESLASLQQQSTDLKSRLKDLSDINSKNANLLSLKDNEIAQLQAQLAAARKASTAATPTAEPGAATSTSVAKPAVPPAAMPESAPANAATAAGSAMAAIAPAGAATTGSSAATSTSAGTTPTPAVTAAPKPAVTPVVSKPAAARAPAPVVEDPWYMQPWAWIAGAVAAVALLLALLARRRRPAAAGKLPSSLAERFGATPGSTVGAEDIDQEELLDQLAEHPDDVGLHLELVTLYYSRRDIEHFEAAAEAMHAHIADPQQDEWQDVLHMGEDLVPGHPLFDHHEPLLAHEETEARRAFDIDEYAVEPAVPAPAAPPLPASDPVPKKVSEYSFNFDLTSSASHPVESGRTVLSPVAAPPIPESPVAEPESSWRFGETHGGASAGDQGHELGEFTDDAVDTKLDLARAYLDMGDADGARAMLGEVVKEGSQVQQDAARRLLDSLH
jgi:pilus assembly protein FimV